MPATTATHGSCRSSEPGTECATGSTGPSVEARRNEEKMTDHQIFEGGDVVLQSGLTYRGARLAYKTYGKLDADKSNVIVYPTSYGAQHPDLEWLIGPDKILDSSRYFIIIP